MEEKICNVLEELLDYSVANDRPLIETVELARMLISLTRGEEPSEKDVRDVDAIEDWLVFYKD